MNFYDNFLKLCNATGVTPSRAVQEAGLKKSAVTRWKAGGNPTDATKQKLANYFHVTVDELTDGTKKEPTLETSKSGLPSDYEILNEANKAIVDRLIVDLAKTQSSD